MGATDWIREWFNRRRPGLKPEETSGNYFDRGLVDSLGVIELIGDVEKEFNVRFNENHFQDRRFATVEGLAQMIEELQREQKK